jgi:hypothetical protein
MVGLFWFRQRRCQDVSEDVSEGMFLKADVSEGVSEGVFLKARSTAQSGFT